MNFKSAYIGYLDILGFGDLIVHNFHGQMVKLYEAAMEKIFQELPRMIGTCIHKRVNTSIIQDSIILWIEAHPTDPEITSLSLYLLLGTIQILLEKGFSEGIPIRGAIACGEISILNKRPPNYSVQAILGLPYLKAYQKEQGQEWMGCICTESVIASLTNEQISDLINERIIIKYKVPQRNHPVKEEYVIVWHTNAIQRDAEKIVRAKFSAHNKNVDSRDVKYKILNTIKFIKEVPPNQATISKIFF